MKLREKTAIVTGGARGIGRAICERYASEGATVVVADILGADAEATATAIGGAAFAVEVDVSRPDSIDAMVAAVVTRMGGVDVLVNGAGIFDMAPLADVTEASYERVFAVNVKGVLFATQAAAMRMVEQRRGGKIVNIASQAGRRGEVPVSVYCASKAAVISMTQSTGLELIKHGINVNAIAPGYIDTPMWDHVDTLFAALENIPIGEKKSQVGKTVPYGRMGVASDLAGAAVFLASDDADYIVAQTLNVDGGNCLN